MTEISAFKEYIEKAKAPLDLTASLEVKQALKKGHMSLTKMGRYYILSTETPWKSAPIRLSNMFREMGWFTSPINEKLYLLATDQNIANEQARSLKETLKTVYEIAAVTTTDDQIKIASKTANVIVSKYGRDWFVKSKGQRSTLKVLTRTDKRLEQFAKLIQRLGLYIHTFNVVKDNKFNQYAFMGYNKNNLVKLADDYLKHGGAYEVANAFSEITETEKLVLNDGDFTRRLQQAREESGFDIQNYDMGWVIRKELNEEYLDTQEIQHMQDLFESLAAQLFPDYQMHFNLLHKGKLYANMGIGLTYADARACAKLVQTNNL